MVAKPEGEEVRYKRARFSTRLPSRHLYTASHSWLLEEESGIWRIGFTKFATRMLGDLVEYDFEVKPGDSMEVGQRLGGIEGFKAFSEVYAVAEGTFLGANPALDEDVTLIDTDPYGKGWFYRVEGDPDPASVDVHGYVTLLDGTIDRMLRSQKGGEE